VRTLFSDHTRCCLAGKKLAQGRFWQGRLLPEATTHVEVEAADLSR
jgi:hypothetical protein